VLWSLFVVMKENIKQDVRMQRIRGGWEEISGRRVLRGLFVGIGLGFGMVLERCGLFVYGCRRRC
jgi:hypothetical protein